MTEFNLKAKTALCGVVASCYYQSATSVELWHLAIIKVPQLHAIQFEP